MDAQMLTHVEFRSDKFPPMENEEKWINPDLWGKRLADFLRVGLHKQGIETQEPTPEDWGWRLTVIHQEFSTWIGCGHYQEYDDGYLCFIEPHKPFIWKLFRRVDTKQSIAHLQKAIDRALSVEGIRAKRWWTYEEFSNQYRNDNAPHSQT